jgi:hypothetical protein
LKASVGFGFDERIQRYIFDAFGPAQIFGPYGPQFSDGYCGEPIAWGHAILVHIGEENWKKAAEYGQLECDHGSGA